MWVVFGAQAADLATNTTPLPSVAQLVGKSI